MKAGNVADNKIPDPIGILNEGEIQVRSSHPIKSAPGGESSVILGDVLVTRHPCKVPTDIQKVWICFGLFTKLSLTYL